jgi:hypothetical protein
MNWNKVLETFPRLCSWSERNEEDVRFPSESLSRSNHPLLPRVSYTSPPSAFGPIIIFQAWHSK